jgi:biotin carboxylase
LAEHFFYEHYDDLVAGIARVTTQVDVDLIMPYDELESLYVSKNIAQIRALAPVVPLTFYPIFKEAIDKQGLRHYLEKQGLNVMPPSMDIKEATVTALEEKVGLPLLLKPARGYFGQGIFTCQTSSDLRNYLPIAQSTNEVFEAQHFVYGSDVTCNVLCSQGEILHHTIQESPAKGVKNYARNDDLQFKEDPAVIDFVAPILKALQWNGIACIDLRRSTSTNQLYLLEINGRFWGSVMSSLEKANVNFPLLMVQYALHQVPLTYHKQNKQQLSLHSYVNALKRGKIKSPGQTKYLPYLQDPLARLMKYIPR